MSSDGAAEATLPVPQECDRLRSPLTCICTLVEPRSDWQGPFPLTPTLSLGERESPPPARERFKRFGFGDRRACVLPLPKGWGEGEEVWAVSQLPLSRKS